ncbi:MAG: hypothetical protein IAE81_10475 [Caldilineaceae bacterium]|nr:hypothetical protein [Caldilineaceae bacterium]
MSRRSINRAGFYSLLLAAMMGVAGCGQLDFAMGPLLSEVTVSKSEITPNADGQDDVTEITYTLRRPADVSIYFENDAGERFYFRDNRRRAPGAYSVLWGGVVDNPETVDLGYGPVEILSRVLPDGDYRWVVAAVEDNGAPVEASGQITLRNGDTIMPELQNFTVAPEIFRPNQDGLADDRVSIGYFLTKEVQSINLFLRDPQKPELRYFIAEAPGLVKPTERGYHDYSYDGGVDLNAEPPPDGTYELIGEARDAAGNSVRVVRELTFEEGGKPRADVVGGEIDWEGENGRIVLLALGDKLCFTAYIENESLVPIRTSGPWPGQVYHYAENYNTLSVAQDEPSWLQQDGAWRFGINFDTTGIDFPYRWAIGRQEDLEKRVIDGREQWYLMPGKRGQVSGCIVLDEKPPIGTRFWWGGLIHQGVEVANNNIDRITVELGTP